MRDQAVNSLGAQSVGEKGLSWRGARGRPAITSLPPTTHAHCLGHYTIAPLSTSLASYTSSAPATANNSRDHDITLSHGSKHLHLNTVQSVLFS